MRFLDGSGISWTICKQSAPHSRQITTPTSHHSMFTGRMLLPMPDQQCQSTEGTVHIYTDKYQYPACGQYSQPYLADGSSISAAVWQVTLSICLMEMTEIGRHCEFPTFPGHLPRLLPLLTATSALRLGEQERLLPNPNMLVAVCKGMQAVKLCTNKILQFHLSCRCQLMQVVGCWRGYLSGARCRLAYGPADATATHCLLLQ